MLLKSSYLFVFLDSDTGDYDYELSLEMKRQKIQRELMKLEQENLEKREDIVVKKDEALIKARVTAMPKVGEQFQSQAASTLRITLSVFSRHNWTVFHFSISIFC